MASQVPRVLFVSKPLVAPLHDGSLCLVRDLATGLEGIAATVFTRPGPHPLPGHDVQRVELRAGRRRFGGSLVDNSQVLAHLLTDRSDLWHFVFAPNPRSCGPLSWLKRRRAIPSVQTVASAPASFSSARQLLFGDVVVTHSVWAQTWLQQFAPRRRIEVIYPAVALPRAGGHDDGLAFRAALHIAPDAPLFCYPGDLEFSSAARTLVGMMDELRQRLPGAVLVMACRPKTSRAQAIAKELARLAPAEGVRFVGELPSLAPLLRAATAVLFPVDDLYGKVDLPVSLLEAMALGCPVVTYNYGPLAELEGTVQVPTGNVSELLAAVTSLATDAERRQQSTQLARSFLAAKCDPARRDVAYQRLYDDLLGR